MSVFRRVDAAQAHPGALGILIPLGPRTLVILRPNALEWDLLPAHWSGEARQAPVFCLFTREEAPGIARKLVQTLEDAVVQRLSPLETFGNGPCFQVWLRTPDFVWILCRRAAGEAYRPAIFGTREEAVAAGERVAKYVWPVAGGQEIYFNTQKFAESV
jgi:hypothetical protein